MKKMAAILLVCLSLFLLLPCSFAQAKELVEVAFDPRTDYDINYSVGEQSPQVAKSMRILGLANIGGKVFLQINKTNRSTDVPGYIQLDSIVTILPTNSLTASAAS